MPLYDFTCSCGHTAEKIVSMSTTKAECPKCGEMMERQFSAVPAFYFKGAGAYCEKSISNSSVKKGRNE